VTFTSTTLTPDQYSQNCRNSTGVAVAALRNPGLNANESTTSNPEVVSSGSGASGDASNGCWSVPGTGVEAEERKNDWEDVDQEGVDIRSDSDVIHCVRRTRALPLLTARLDHTWSDNFNTE
jgi:hypothetical protein